MFDSIMGIVLIAIFVVGVRGCIDSEVSAARFEERSKCKCEHLENRSEYSACVEEIENNLKEEK